MVVFIHGIFFLIGGLITSITSHLSTLVPNDQDYNVLAFSVKN